MTEVKTAKKKPGKTSGRKKNTKTVSSQRSGPPLRRFIFWALIILLFFGFLFLIRDMLLPFILGMLIAYFLDPAADKLEEWKCSRGVATSIITVIFFALLIIFLLALTPVLAKQITGLMADIPGYIESLRVLLIEQMSKLPLTIDWENGLDTQAITQKIFSNGQGLAGRLIESGMALINLVSLLVITPVVSFYLLRDWDRLTAKIDSLLPRDHADTIRTQLAKIDETLAGFIRGQFNVMLILGCFYATALYLAGLKYAIIIGLIAGFLIIIPYIGTLIGGLLSTGIAFMQFGDWQGVGIVAGIFVIGQMLEGYALTPKLVGDRVGLHPVWIIFGMLAGASLFGFVGVLIAVPVTAVIGVLVRFMIERYVKSELYQGSHGA